MKTKLLVFLMLAGSSLVAGPRFYVGFGVAPPPVAVYAPPPAPYYHTAPPCPGPGYTWVGGYWYPVRHRYYWRTGYWARPPYVGARWIAPRYYGRRYYAGYWRR